MLKDYKERCKQNIILFNNDYFVVGSVTPYSAGALSAKFKKYFDEFEIKNRIRIHDFRNSNILFLINLGVDIFQIAKRVGIRTLNRYLKHTVIYTLIRNKK